MTPSLIIARKRDGHVLTREEIDAFVRGTTDGSWADYQLSALLMAIYLRGMTAEETTDPDPGDHAVGRDGRSFRRGKQPKADKHSTRGGVGDKVSLHLAPMVAACAGVAVPMISGRGLGHTGGTLDKLESIAGLRVGLSLAEDFARPGAADQGGLHRPDRRTRARRIANFTPCATRHGHGGMHSAHLRQHHGKRSWRRASMPSSWTSNSAGEPSCPIRRGARENCLHHDRNRAGDGQTGSRAAYLHGPAPGPDGRQCAGSGGIDRLSAGRGSG